MLVKVISQFAQTLLCRGRVSTGQFNHRQVERRAVSIWARPIADRLQLRFGAGKVAVIERLMSSMNRGALHTATTGQTDQWNQQADQQRQCGTGLQVNAWAWDPNAQAIARRRMDEMTSCCMKRGRGISRRLDPLGPSSTTCQHDSCCILCEAWPILSRTHRCEC